MALLDTEGFGMSTNLADYVTYGRMSIIAGSQYTSSITTNGPLGDNYLNNIGGILTNVYRLTFISPSTGTFFYGQRFLYVNNPYIYFYSLLTTEQFHITINQIGQISVIRNATTIGTSATGAIPISGWQYLEIGAVISTTIGSVTIRVNGVVVLNITNVNNQNASDTTIQFVCWGTGGNPNYTCSVAHVYFSDATGPAPWNTFLGDVRVQTLLPISNSGVQGFTPIGLASNWQNAAKIPPVPATDYNTASIIGTTDLFNYAPTSLGVILGMTQKSLFSKSDAGNRTLAQVLVSSSTTIIGASINVGISPLLYSSTRQIDPNTSGSWTTTSLNATKSGYTIIG